MSKAYKIGEFDFIDYDLGGMVLRDIFLIDDEPYELIANPHDGYNNKWVAYKLSDRNITVEFKNTMKSADTQYPMLFPGQRNDYKNFKRRERNNAAI